VIVPAAALVVSQQYEEARQLAGFFVFENSMRSSASLKSPAMDGRFLTFALRDRMSR